ncbi:hypothetical protein ACFQFQ_05290 [Sulfitobacter porphyrae]|uniref:EamA domain-containing protein n=1 Tax=Sulfitobacter porphyrae TaxID=1246864 RepID=A0ABW2B0K1_9RHOB
MRLALFTALTMIAFAANSVLTRLAIEGQHIDPSGFAIVRVASGALVLGMVITLRGGGCRCCGATGCRGRSALPPI